MQYAKIENDKVVHVILCDAEFASKLPGEWLPSPDGVGIGWYCISGVFSSPGTNPDISVNRTITKLVYTQRFTQAERIGIRSAAAVSPVVQDYIELLVLAQDVNLDHPETISGVNALEAAGLLAPGRAAEILA